jgi:hypothetical protein
LPVLRRRRSTFIGGIEDDAREVIDHLSGSLAGDPRGTPAVNQALPKGARARGARS